MTRLLVLACVIWCLTGCAFGSDVAPTVPVPATPASSPIAVPSATPTALPVPPLVGPTPTLVPPTPVPTATPRPPGPGDRILFFRDEALWISDLSGATPTRLMNLGYKDEQSFEEFGLRFPPRVSPDGRYLVTLTNGMGSWLVSTDGREQRPFPEPHVHPSWSPDSLAITYALSDTIYIRRLDDWDQRRAIAHLESRSVAFAEWSPDGTWIAFLAYEPSTATPSGAKQQLWLVHPDGTQLHMLESIDALGHGPGPNEVQWGDGGRIVLAFSSEPWILVPAPEHRFVYPFPLPYEPPRVTGLSAKTPFGIGWSDGRIFAITFADRPGITELRDCGAFVRGWSPDGTRLLCAPDSMSRLNVTVYSATNEFAHTMKIFALPGADGIFLTPNGDALIFDTRLEDEVEHIMWYATLDPMSKARRIGRGVLAGVFRSR